MAGLTPLSKMKKAELEAELNSMGIYPYELYPCDTCPEGINLLEMRALLKSARKGKGLELPAREYFQKRK